MQEIAVTVRRQSWTGSQLTPGRSVLTAVVAGTMLLPAVRAGDAAQNPELLRAGSAVCPDCTVRLTHLVTLGDTEGLGTIGSLSTITQMSDGRYVLSYNESDAELVVFSPDGRFLERFGRRGEGPGEFQWVRWARAANDKLHVFDARLLRRTVFSPDFRVIATDRFQGVPLADVLVLDDTTLVMNALFLSSEQVGYALHVYGDTGASLTSIAEDPDGYRFDVSEEVLMRYLARASSGGIWSAHRTRYRIDEWDANGNLRRVFERGAEWFPNHLADDGIRHPSRPPMPRITNIRADRDGLLWVLIMVPSDEWPDALSIAGPGAHPEMAGRYVIERPNRAYDTVVEVIDPRTAEILVSSRFDPFLFTFAGDDQVVSVTRDADLTPRIQIWKLNLDRSANDQTRP